ncbi:NAD(P)-binding protein, partial [Pelagibacteraceae bacterium]|nr:NAD(P)-binding protein [Pelagibacteraceae bacterium]
MKKHDIVIIGAGPSGLAAATEAIKKTTSIKIFEKSKNIGGLARSENFKGCIFDVGPHRFYTLNSEINNFFRNNIKKDSIEVKRLTRILYKKKLFLYPLSPFNTLFKLGIIEAIQMLTSYLYVKIFSIFFKFKINNFEDWVINNFGRKLYTTFFKSYTEKVWGIDCNKISADWASQRIKNLSFISVILNPIRKFFIKKKIKSLVDSFL